MVKLYGNGAEIGGIVGDVVLSSQVLNCYNTGKIKCEKGGGIVGDLTGGSTIANCYNIGTIETNFMEYAGIISYTAPSKNTIRNNYYLENVINGTSNDRIIIDGIEAMEEENLKGLSSVLGVAFKEDADNINNGYPILQWQ